MTDWPTIHEYVVTYTVGSLPDLGQDGLLHARVAALSEDNAATAVRTGVTDALTRLLPAEAAAAHTATLQILGVLPAAPAGSDPDPKVSDLTDHGVHFDEYDLTELVAFHSKADTEGFTYAYENYPPRFAAESLMKIAADMGDFRRLYTENEHLVDEWWEHHETEGGELLDAHMTSQDRTATT